MLLFWLSWKADTRIPGLDAPPALRRNVCGNVAKVIPESDLREAGQIFWSFTFIAPEFLALFDKNHVDSLSIENRHIKFELSV